MFVAGEYDSNEPNRNERSKTKSADAERKSRNTSRWMKKLNQASEMECEVDLTGSVLWQSSASRSPSSSTNAESADFVCCISETFVRAEGKVLALIFVPILNWLRK